MSAVTIYGTWFSDACRGVFLTARQLGIDFKKVEIDLLKGENREDWYRQINPQTFVPFLDDDGFKLPESRAISAYLVNSRAPGSSLYPADPQKRAVVDQRLYFEATVMFVNADNFWYYVHDGNTEINEHHRNKLLGGLETVNRFLTGSKYVAGDELTIADFHILSIVVELYHLGAPIDNYPEVKRWLELCKATVVAFEDNWRGAKSTADYISSKLTKKF